MSDVAQILGLAGPGGGGSGPAGPARASDLSQLKPAGAPAGPARAKGRPKKLTGMQREVLELLESSHRASHSLYQGFSKPTLRQKWSERRHTPATKWYARFLAALPQ